MNSKNRRPCAVVALGGNAISPPDKVVSVARQFRQTRESMKGIVSILQRDYLLAIVHGNGPQVGAALRRVEMAKDELPFIPLGMLVADTEGSMGYMIEQSLQNLLVREGIKRDVITIITQVLVDQFDPALKDPSKFIGKTFSKNNAEKLMQTEGWEMKPFGGDDKWRRVVGSPKPIGIINAEMIRKLVDSGTISIVAGGGGIPVYKDPKHGLDGIDAVIDKDLAAAVVGKEIGAEELFILTNIEKVFLNYGKPDQKSLSRMTVREAQTYLEDGHFPPGSMGPKVRAAIQFIEQGGQRAIICALEQINSAIHNKAGTLITQ